MRTGRTMIGTGNAELASRSSSLDTLYLTFVSECIYGCFVCGCGIHFDCVYQAVAHWASVTACRMGIIILFQGRLVALDQIGHDMGRNFAK